MPFSARMLAAVGITLVSDAELTFAKDAICSVNDGGHELYHEYCSSQTHKYVVSFLGGDFALLLSVSLSLLIIKLDSIR
jgi:hypothetical protein